MSGPPSRLLGMVGLTSVPGPCRRHSGLSPFSFKSWIGPLAIPTRCQDSGLALPPGLGSGLTQNAAATGLSQDSLAAWDLPSCPE